MDDVNKVSIIIPVYNVEGDIFRCLESVVNQSYENLEIIIINDGSTDSSLEICKEFERKDNRIYLISQENGGPSVARDTGLDVMTGDYFMFVDSDDSIDRRAVEKMLHVALERDVDLVISGFISDNGISRSPCVLDQTCIYDNFGVMKAFLTEKYVNNVVWNKLYLRSMHGKVRFTGYRKYEDVLYTTRILSLSQKAVYINECLYVYNIRQDSLVRSRISEKDLILFDIIEEKHKIIRTSYPELYYCIENEYLESIYNLLKKIVLQFQYKKKKLLYHSLLERLENAYTDKQGSLSKSARDKLYMPIKHPVRFKTMCRIKGMQTIIKGFVKKLLKSTNRVKALGKR